MPPDTHTPPRQIRIRDDLWDRFGAATDGIGVERSTAVREFIEWYLHEPHAKRLTRPAPPTDVEVAEWRAKQPPRRNATP